MSERRCLIDCITTDDEGRGYWCPDCPELADPHTQPSKGDNRG